MPDSPTARLEQLRRMLERSPKDAFLLYGIALEDKKLGNISGAMEYLNKVIEVDPGYCYAYYQRGLVQESLGDLEAAKRSYRDGIAAATRTNDAHARSELEGALSMIE